MHSHCSWVSSSLHPDSPQKPLHRATAAIRQTCPGRRLTLTPVKCINSPTPTPAFYSKCTVVKTIILTFLKPLLWGENKVFWHIQTPFTFDWKSKFTSAQNSFDYLETTSFWPFHEFFLYFKLFQKTKASRYVQYPLLFSSTGGAFRSRQVRGDMVQELSCYPSAIPNTVVLQR